MLLAICESSRSSSSEKSGTFFRVSVETATAHLYRAALPRGKSDACSKDKRMQVHVVGCSPAWPNPGGSQSGYLVEEDGRRLLLDCGPGVLPRLRRLEGWPRLDAIVITHFHLDHWGDLVPWAFGGLFGAGREVPAPELWPPRGGRDTLHGLDPVLYANAVLELFDVHEYEERTTFSAAGF